VCWTRPPSLAYRDSVTGATKKYYPDFFLPASGVNVAGSEPRLLASAESEGVYIETKGKYPKKDVAKMRDVFKAHPGVRICLVRPSDFDVLNLMEDDAALHDVFAMDGTTGQARQRDGDETETIIG